MGAMFFVWLFVVAWLGSATGAGAAVYLVFWIVNRRAARLLEAARAELGERFQPCGPELRRN